MTAPKLGDVLADLPDTADAIAALLIEADCQGSPRNGTCCPMANYLIRLGFTEPFVQPDHVFAERNRLGDGPNEPTPMALREFVERFDDNAWPELVSEDS